MKQLLRSLYLLKIFEIILIKKLFVLLLFPDLLKKLLCRLYRGKFQSK